MSMGGSTNVNLISTMEGLSQIDAQIQNGVERQVLQFQQYEWARPICGSHS